MFRTRLTHSLEVAQLGRSMARSLALNEDLVEAIALAHDLGHTPFGHAGQDALNRGLVVFAGTHPEAGGAGGFEHNLQSLRVVDRLERRYPLFDGLNLCFETREGVLKHCSRSHAQRLSILEPGGVALRFLEGGSPSMEAQLCNLADEIAYNAHDIDDGVRSGLLCLEQLEEVQMFDSFRRMVCQEHPGLDVRRTLYETIRRMLSEQVYDVLQQTRANLDRARPESVGDVRKLPCLVEFSPCMKEASNELKRFLFRTLYRSPQVQATTELAKQVIDGLFSHFLENENDVPYEAMRYSAARRAADYIAGMTDRFAIRTHERVTGMKLFS